MRWFERYGIVGASFLVITFFWITSLSYFTIQQAKMLNYLIGLGASTLPIGYVITVVSQFLYYTQLGGKQIHRESTKIIFSTCGQEYSEKKLGLSEEDDEATCEAKLTALLRLEKVKGINLEQLQYLGIFVTSRFDVLAVNNSIILATLVAPLVAIVVVFACPIFTFKFDKVFFIIVLYTTITIVALLKAANKFLANQILEIHKKVLVANKADMKSVELITQLKSYFFTKINNSTAYVIIFFFWILVLCILLSFP